MHSEVLSEERGGLEQLAEGVAIRRVVKVNSERLTRIVERINGERIKLENARRDASDHEKLMAEAEAAMDASLRRKEEATRRERQMEELKQGLLLEERSSEEERGRKHAQAVQAENERAAAKAEKIIAERTMKHTRDLAKQHEIGARHARELMRAHEIALHELESNIKRLEEKLVEVEVIGERITVETAPFDIEVRVEPEEVPEARIQVEIGEIRRGVLRAHIEERLPQREAVRVPAERREERRERREVIERIEARQPLKESRMSVSVTTTEREGRMKQKSRPRSTTLPIPRERHSYATSDLYDETPRVYEDIPPIRESINNNPTLFEETISSGAPNVVPLPSSANISSSTNLDVPAETARHSLRIFKIPFSESSNLNQVPQIPRI